MITLTELNEYSDHELQCMLIIQLIQINGNLRDIEQALLNLAEKKD